MSEQKNQKKAALVPRLRFPEFREAGWVSTFPLDSVADFINEKTSTDQLDLGRYVSTENLLPDFGGMISATKLPFIPSVTRFQKKDVLISNIRPYLKKVWQSDIDGGVSNDVLVVRAKANIDSGYLGAILRSDFFIDYVMRGAKGVKMPRGEISMIQEFPVPYPCAEEQQKIAGCLSSLDELITAENQKLDALKTHKKGLMQQLFPREGETVPRLRFPEFREAGEWEEKSLGVICEILNNRRQPISGSQRKAGPYPYYGASGVVDYVDNYLFDERLLLVGEDGAKWGSFDSTAFIAEGKFWVNNHAHVLKPIALNDAILENYLVMLDLGPYVTGAAPPKLTLAKLKGIPICFPAIPLEQQKIADCLSSIDELITAENQKLDALKTHKKGLMQQLFPVLEEAAA